MNYDFYQNCVDINYYDTEYVNSINQVIEAINNIHSSTYSKRLELELLLNYYEL
jgi:hypothetical protein